MLVDLARAKELFLAVLEMSAAERAAYLETACAGDSALHQRIVAMLQTHANSGELLSRAPAEILADCGMAGADATTAFGQPARPPAEPTEQNDMGVHDLTFLAPSTRPGLLGRLGHYEVQEVIGKGGFGIVLKAFDERLHRVVAIKVLSPAYAANGSARKRFIREARAAAAVKNEHVVGIYDVQEDAQPPYLVMEMIDGISLQDKIDRQGTLGVKEILRIGMQIAEGLAAAHRQGLVHRDIKPANILLENGVERVKITDFGLARAVDDASVTQSCTVAGTPMYMSPEQADGLPIDHRSDLFSLGTVLYAMCTGHPPFRASGTHAVLKRVIDAAPRPIRESNNELPEWLCVLITKLHAKKREDRFPTAKEVAELLGQRLADVQAGRAVQGEPSRVSDRVKPATTSAELTALTPVKPRKRLWAYACIAVAALLVGGLTIAELTDLTHYFHTPHYWINLGVDDPNITIRIVPAGMGDDPERTIAESHEEEPLHMVQFKGQRRIQLAAGNYWFAAQRDGKTLYHQLVTVDQSRVVLIPWAAAVAKSEKQKHPSADAPAWVQLFKGKNLDGWVSHVESDQPPQRAWEILGDILISRGSPNGYLRTTKPYESFILELECQASHPFSVANPVWAGDLLLQIPVPDPGLNNLSGLRLQIMPGSKKGVLVSRGIAPALQVNAIDWTEFKADWNLLRIEFTPGMLAIVLNGKQIQVVSGYRPTRGYIGIMSVATGMRYRNIRIRCVSSSTAKP
jgi:serine/threonine protein kinase